MGDKETKLSIIVDAQDKTGSALSGIKGSLDQTKMSLDGITDAMNSVGKVGAVAFSGLSAGVGLAINEATEANKVLAQLDAVLESTGGTAGVTRQAAIDLADSLAQITLFTDDAILDMENLLLTTTNIGKDAFPDATQAVLDMATAMDTDLQSAAIQISKALNDPTEGISALTRNNVIFTDQQKEMIKTLQESGDMLGAQQIILGELAKEFGGSAEAAKEADPFGFMKNQIGELSETIGRALLPAFQSIIDNVSPLIDKITLWAQENPKLTETIVIIAGVLTGLMAVMLPLSFVIQGMMFVVTGLNLAFATTALTLPVLVGLIAAVTFAIIQISGIVKILKNDWDTTWLGMQLTVYGVVNSIISAIESMINFLIEGINTVIRVINSLIEKLASIPKIGDAFAGLKIDEIQGVVLNKLDTQGLVDNFTANQQPAVQNTVNINGGTYLDPDVAQEIGDTIIDGLTLSTNV